jgi:hypothetical protein
LTPFHSVNFDFGPGDRYDGFDFWRLSCFVDEKPELYKSYFENKVLLKQDFQALVEKHFIVEPKWFPGSSLYYFSDVVK